jgi:hypothetical protein
VKTRKPSLIFLVLSFVFLLLYVLVGFGSWRFGFLPPNQSFIERVVTIVFFVMICSSPLGVLSAVSLTRSARKQDAAQNEQKAFELRTRARWRLIGSPLDCASGALGYYLISRRVFPQIDVIWIFSALFLPPALLQVYFRLRWNSLKQQQLLNQMPTQRSSGP